MANSVAVLARSAVRCPRRGAILDAESSVWRASVLVFVFVLLSCATPYRLLAAGPQTAAPGAAFPARSSGPSATVDDLDYTFRTTAIGQTDGVCFRVCFCTNPANCTCDKSGTRTLDHDLSPPFSAFNYQVQPYSGANYDCKSGTPVTLPAFVNAGQQLTFDMEFTPTSNGTFSDYLTLGGLRINVTGATPQPSGGCTANGTTLCIDSRFQVQVSYHTAEGGGLFGSGNAIGLSNEGVTEGGLFWFFAAANPEMLIKVIDGCSLGGHFWVFFAATTNVGFTVTVTDTSSGHQATYTNPDLTAALPVQDTGALPCP
jgi:hypothetical protein